MTNNVIYPNDAFNLRLDDFMVALNLMLADTYKRAYKNLEPPMVSADPGNKYIRIVRTDANGKSRSVHCFIDKSNGDVLKADGWKRPAKHARGNIFNADCGMGGVTPYGARYL